MTDRIVAFVKCETTRPTNCAPERTAAELRSVVSSFFSEGRWDDLDMNSELAEDWKGERKQARRMGGWRRTEREQAGRRGENGQGGRREDDRVGRVRQTKHDEWRGWRSDSQNGFFGQGGQTVGGFHCGEVGQQDDDGTETGKGGGKRGRREVWGEVTLTGEKRGDG